MATTCHLNLFATIYCYHILYYFFPLDSFWSAHRSHNTQFTIYISSDSAMVQFICCVYCSWACVPVFHCVLVYFYTWMCSCWCVCLIFILFAHQTQIQITILCDLWDILLYQVQISLSEHSFFLFVLHIPTVSFFIAENEHK